MKDLKKKSPNSLRNSPNLLQEFVGPGPWAPGQWARALGQWARNQCSQKRIFFT